jgi:ADP-heptose:LPS heptosyltransferase
LFALPQTAALRGNQYVCIHAGARWPSRRWPAERFAEVADHLAEDGWPIVLTGSPAERDLVDDVRLRMRSFAIDLCGHTTLGALSLLVRNARLVISNDTGMAHIAAAVRTPSVIVALGSDIARWAPLDRQRHRVVMAAADCRPCEHFVCPVDHHCARNLTTSMVLRAAQDQLMQFAPTSELPSPIMEDQVCVRFAC